MDNFNYKQFLFENKIGVYAKAGNVSEDLSNDQDIADAQMQMQDAQNGNMGTMAENKKGKTHVKLSEIEITVLGKEYLVSGTADVKYEYEEPEYEQGRLVAEGGYVVTDAKLEIEQLMKVDEKTDSYVPVKHPDSIKQIEDLINTDPKLKRRIEDEATAYVEDSIAENSQGFSNEEVRDDSM